VTEFESICEKCEQLLQPYLDRDLDETERLEAESHLDNCDYCRTRYHFEASLRRYVRTACTETMSPELKAKLATLRTPLEGA
jgi:anti-sigma factor (TIGR02949 family)